MTVGIERESSEVTKAGGTWKRDEVAAGYLSERSHFIPDRPRQLEEVRREYVSRPDRADNILALVEDQCRWLRDIGFRDVDCFWKYFELAIFGGRRA
jgi:hypothetical protein